MAILQSVSECRARIKVNSPILLILTLKLVAMATSVESSEKGTKIGSLGSNTYHMVKI